PGRRQAKSCTDPMSITVASAKGLRAYQEDRSVIHTTDDGVLLGVLDGHGGAEVAEKAMRAIPAAWEKSNGSPADRLRATVAELAAITQADHSGAALSLVYASNGEAHIAILGDAPVIVSKPDGTIHVSEEH